MVKKTLVIIDGKSVYYRGYYAMGNLSKSDGTPTGGIYGFATIAMELVADLKPDKVVVAWDKAGTSIKKRKAIYSDYKAGRVKPPEDFYAQIPLLKNLISALNWDFLERDEYEADDIIGTLSAQADRETFLAEGKTINDYTGVDKTAPNNWETIIISSDLDMLQIVDENTKMYRLLKGFSKIEEVDVSAVEAKYGIKKSQFLDLKALKGDSSDNIPGVPGIGEKTAAKLLNEFGSLENIYNHLDEITPNSVREKLIKGKDSAFMSYKLGKIMFDAPVDLTAVPWHKIDPEKVITALRDLEFSSLERKFRKSLNLTQTDFSPTAAAQTVVKTTTQETATQEPTKTAAPAIEIPSDLAIVWDVKAKMNADESFAQEILSGKKFYDLEQGKFLLNPLMRKGKTDGEVKQMMFNFSNDDENAEYLRQMEAYQSCPKVYKILTDFDLPMIPVLYKIERAGMKISKSHFESLRIEYQEKCDKLLERIYAAAGKEFNVNSPIQLSEILFTTLALPTKGIKKTTRGYSTGVKELNKLKDSHPIIPLIIEYREVSKLLSTYIIPFPNFADANDRIHTTLTQDITATGRLSSINPNLQNIPVRTEEGKRIRTGFIAEKGRKIISADYSQFELRLAAVLAGDKNLIADFNADLDIHKKTASDAFHVPMNEVTKEQRRAAKVVNFGILYGMSVKGLSEAAGMGFYEAKRFIEDYFRVRQPIRDYLDRILTQARTEGFVETYFGRRRPTPDVHSPNFIIRSGAERAAQNMPIQGTEADLMKRAMITLDKKLPKTAAMIMQVHDSIMVECDEADVKTVSALMKTVMENIAPELPIKLAVDVKSGDNWGEL